MSAEFEETEWQRKNLNKCEHGVPEGDECDACYLGEESRIKDRIRLAEAMGWQGCFVGTDGECYGIVPPGQQFRPCTILPDPFTDANDDYAVLEWIRGRGGDMTFAADWLYQGIDYKIGDYARAALKVLE